jgi:hypothetical protein
VARGARARYVSGAKNWRHGTRCGRLLSAILKCIRSGSAGSIDGVRSVAEVIGDLCDGAERLLRERSRTLIR